MTPKYPTPDADKEQINLAHLIQDHQRRTGESYSDIARRAGLSKAKIGQLTVSDSPHMPRIETLKKLAVGLKLPLRIVQHAAMASAGLSPEDTNDDQRTDLIITKLDQLSPADLASVEVFIDALLRQSANG